MRLLVYLAVLYSNKRIYSRELTNLGLIVRQESPADAAAVKKVLTNAFETSAEASIVDSVRASEEALFTLVAEHDGVLAGHIMFSPVTLASQPGLRAQGLAPVAVMPSLQQQGVGSALIEAGLHRCREANIDVVFVLGDPAYYERFGFSSAAGYGIDSEYQVPADYFMLLELKPGVLGNTHGGTARYLTAFEMA